MPKYNVPKYTADKMMGLGEYDPEPYPQEPIETDQKLLDKELAEKVAVELERAFDEWGRVFDECQSLELAIAALTVARPIIERQLLGELSDWEHERSGPSETLAEAFARERGITLPKSTER